MRRMGNICATDGCAPSNEMVSALFPLLAFSKAVFSSPRPSWTRKLPVLPWPPKSGAFQLSPRKTSSNSRLRRCQPCFSTPVPMWKGEMNCTPLFPRDRQVCCITCPLLPTARWRLRPIRSSSHHRPRPCQPRAASKRRRHYRPQCPLHSR